MGGLDWRCQTMSEEFEDELRNSPALVALLKFS